MEQAILEIVSGVVIIAMVLPIVIFLAIGILSWRG